MRTIIITGSTRGIGSALADAFLSMDCAVGVSGRTDEGVARAREELERRHGSQRVFGTVCDVRDPGQVQALWDHAKTHFGTIDIWVNNAGLSGAQARVWLSRPLDLKEVVETNLLGTGYGSQVAVRGMLDQGHGSIYNMEGLGGDGRVQEGLVPYGMTKRGVNYLTRGLARELRETALVIGSIRPGMVATELVFGQYRGHPEEWERVKGILSIIANRPETVAPWVARRVLENRRSGVCISYLKPWSLLLRFLTAGFVKRDVFGGFDPSA